MQTRMEAQRDAIKVGDPAILRIVDDVLSCFTSATALSYSLAAEPEQASSAPTLGQVVSMFKQMVPEERREAVRIDPAAIRVRVLVDVGAIAPVGPLRQSEA